MHIIPIKTVRGRGKAQGTYACRELVIAYTAWISAAFHLKVIRVFLNQVTERQRSLLPDEAPCHYPPMLPPVWTRPVDCPNYGDNPEGLPRTHYAIGKLVDVLREWARNQLHPTIGNEVIRLCLDINSLLITGGTHLQEAALHLSLAQRMVSQWRGLGGARAVKST